MNQGIRNSYDRVYAAEHERDEMIRATYQVGDVVYYKLRNHHVRAEVLDHSGDRLKVRGMSGKEYWIGAYRLVT